MAISARPRRQAFGAGAIALGQVPFRFNARLTGQLWAWWLGRARGRAMSAELSAQLAFARGERTLMVGRDLDGECTLVATDQALHHRTGSDAWSRLGWEQITRVGWETSPGHLVVTGVTGAAPSPMIVPLRRRGTWSELAQERITHTRLVRQQVMLDRNRHVVIEVRRCPATGELRWALVSGHGLDPGDQDLRNEIERAATWLCADLGITIPSGADQLFLPSLAGPSQAGLPSSSAPRPACLRPISWRFLLD
jgi:hypothetical protein